MKNSPATLPFRSGFLVLLLGLFAPAAVLSAEASANAGDLTIVRVNAGWREAASFKRISEYFSGRENTGGDAVLRTHPEQRGGYYFLVRVANPSAPRAVTARLELIIDATAKPVVHTFTTDLKSGSTVFHLGLTGPAWPDPLADPVAWKLDLTDPAGRVLVTEKSYLWEQPAGE